MENFNHISVADANVSSVRRDKLTRRGFLGIGSAALAVAGIAPALAADTNRSDPGPANPTLDAQNPDSMWPPGTDSKSLVPTFKYPFSLANKRVYEGGWSREVTVRELPVSKSMAGVNMRLTAGGVRELHWHTAGEWAIMLYGTARITAIDAAGKSFVADVKEAAGAFGASPENFAFRTMEMPPTKRTKGGEVRIVDSSTFKASTTVAMAMVTVHPGGLRELHWHPNADEWQYYINGKGRMTVVSTGNRARTMDFQAGDVGYVEKSLLHYIENTGDTDLVLLEMFKSSYYQDLSLSEWLAHTPSELVMAHLRIDKATFDAIPRDEAVIVPS